jgi:uncharacterized protein (DUF4415 family)
VAAKQLKGVGGVLGGLLSPEPAATATPEPPAKPIPPAPATEAADPPTAEQPVIPEPKAKPRPSAQPKIQARRGRPPGRRAGEATVKEKVTLRLSKELMDEYRDWSWDEHCQLGDLVERALSLYRSRRTRQKSQ